MNKFDPKIMAFCCNNSSFLIAKRIPRNEIPDMIVNINAHCCGQVGINELLEALQKGSQGILIMPCLDENCQHLTGNIRARKHVEFVKGLLEELGESQERIRIEPIAANDDFSYREAVNNMYENIRILGPIEGKVSK